MTMLVFPVDGADVHWRDTWGAPRSGGRSHAGTDIYAPRGTPVVAVEPGWATASDGALGGLQVAVTARDGTIYLYAHLDERTGPYPRAVVTREQLGTVGSTGNAAGGPPHLHFEVRPQGGERVNPAPLLERAGERPSTLAEAAGRHAAKVSRKSAAPSAAFGMGGGLVLLGLLLSRKGR